MYNRTSEKKCTASTKIANMILDIIAVRLKPIHENAVKTGVVEPGEWRAVWEMSGVLKTTGVFGEDSSEDLSTMSNEELLAKVQAMRNSESGQWVDEDEEESEDEEYAKAMDDKF